ncbi:hypothetical protein [Pseudoalteromonas aurantia]|uniref:Uncharacterized protein n=1 Tax=Pseudoalteromonas aurantia TaxID=43654 RepID=A0A5S3VFB2_9GAMM|nr:hypothetical protein [Pseudoalteromonas aurantia]TMO65841.1 hypothetical protein CWC18_03875 [Pseudoalteromonas aurantia]TMO70667.1 hypothetical protein CWC19_00020 [Pseudoalteromonas aurantia]TMO72837.1 hypothetical protein CWC20_14385 [Pseudoalteromonas aurantia]
MFTFIKSKLETPETPRNTKAQHTVSDEKAVITESITEQGGKVIKERSVVVGGDVKRKQPKTPTPPDV